MAKQIFEEISRTAKEKGLAQVKNVKIEIGSIALAHDDLPEHVDDVSVENLSFALESLGRETIFEKTRWEIGKIPGNEWKITEITGSS